MNQLSNELIAFFGMHPKLGFISAIVLTTFGSFSPFILDIHIPTIVMESIQVCAWVLGGIASCYTILGWNKKSKKK